MRGEELPEGWAEVRIADVCAVNPRDDHLDDGVEVTFVPMAAVSEVTGAIERPEVRKTQDVRKGFTSFVDEDVIFAKITPCMENGKSAVARGLLNGRGYGSTEFVVLRSKGGIEPSFLHRFVRQDVYRREARGTMQSGVGQARVPKEFIENTTLMLPPLPEQKRIVARLDALQARSRAAREALAEVPALLDTFRQSVLAAAFRGDLTAEWRAENPGAEPASKLLERIRAERKKRWELVNPKKKYAEPERVDDSELPELPDGWNWVSIDEITVDSLYGPRFASDAYCKDGVPTIRTTDLDAHGRVCPKDPPRVRVDAERMNDWGLQQDDLVVTRTGATIGKCALYDASIGPAVPSAYLIRFRLTRDNCHARFVFWFLQSPFGQVLLGSGSRAVAQPNVNATAIRGFPMPLPPYEEQRRITALLDTAEAAFAASRDTASEFRDDLDALDQSILARAFRGELVDQDPNDEPAEALLARIRSGGDDGAPRRGRRGPAKHGPGGTR